MIGRDAPVEGLLGKAAEILREQPLCDRCLGRMFARLGVGLGNDERGKALKTLLVMELHRRIRSGDVSAEEEFKRLAPRLGSYATLLYEQLFGEKPGMEACAVCGGRLGEVIEKAAARAAELVSNYGAQSFLVGCRVPESVVEAEERIKLRHGLTYAESIASEVRREVGKRVRDLTGVEPDFAEPDMVLLVDFETGYVDAHPLPLLFKGRYWKLGRRISQSKWILRDNVKKYPFSVEEALEPAAKLVGASRAVLHAAGREDVDARMLGTGRPMVVELKLPRRLDVQPKRLAEEINSSQELVIVVLDGRARRRDVRLYKSERAKTRKVYRAVFVTDADVNDAALAALEEAFKDVKVRQQTPRRVLHRRPDIVRYRSVYGVKVRRLGPGMFEALISAEGGLYVKELISGDEGRTEPSFSSVLGTQAECLELDVVYVEL